MRCRHLSCDEEFEVIVVLDHLVTEFHQCFRALLFDLLGQKGIKHGVETLDSIFKDNWVAHCDA